MSKSYMTIDDRCSGGQLVEFDMVACKHCSAQIKVTRETREGFWCWHCAGPVCIICAPKDCYPMAKKLMEVEQRRALFRTLNI